MTISEHADQPRLDPGQQLGPLTVLFGLVRACRPKQWLKNVLVFVAPAAGLALVSKDNGSLTIHWHTVLQALLAFGVFCLVAGGTYLINDTVDVESDRMHPKKRNRPIAAGIVPIPVAIVSAVVCIGGGLGLSLWRSWEFCVVVGLYAIQTTLYSFWLKNEPVLDLVALSGGFILRLLGGGYATEVGISNWFFIISCSGALFIAVGKRLAEKREVGESAKKIRKTLAIYTEDYLRFLQGVSAAIVLIAYVMWAFERADHHSGGATPTLLSILPFLVAILRYGLLVELGKGSAPEELFLSDRQLQVVGAIWVVLVGIGFYVGA
ncbi:MAG TPA: decaprenyl-phosphate phosphoribosyltransferase [Acidimicrobiaceae bacterium]|jgi:decaprenyl-phosphate phosphoribosyltransferase|nr:decaprenyl-phosphate phosphoribosyltransferase [Acidimicrobiaceae bacterium]